jgi:hypothetical protein
VPLSTIQTGGETFAVEPSRTASLSREFSFDASFFNNSSSAPVESIKVIDAYGTVLTPAEWDAVSEVKWTNPYDGLPATLNQNVEAGLSFPVTSPDGVQGDFTTGELTKTFDFTVPTPTLLLQTGETTHAIGYVVKITAVVETVSNGVVRTAPLDVFISSTSTARADITDLNGNGGSDCDVAGGNICSDTSGLGFALQAVTLPPVLEDIPITPVDPPVVVPPVEEPPVVVPPVEPPVEEPPVLVPPVVTPPVDVTPVEPTPVVEEPVTPTAGVLAETGAELPTPILWGAIAFLGLGAGLFGVSARRKTVR